MNVHINEARRYLEVFDTDNLMSILIDTEFAGELVEVLAGGHVDDRGNTERDITDIAVLVAMTNAVYDETMTLDDWLNVLADNADRWPTETTIN